MAGGIPSSLTGDTVVIWVYDFETAHQTTPKKDTYCIWVYEGSSTVNQDYIDQFSDFMLLNYTNTVDQGSEAFLGFLERNRNRPILWCVCESGYIRAPAVGLAVSSLLGDAGSFSDLYREYRDCYDHQLLWKLRPY